MLLRSVLCWVDAHDCESKLFSSSPVVCKWMETVLLWLLFQVVVKTWVDLPDFPDLKVEINIQE